MFSNADEVLTFIKDEDVKFVDVRFCDLPGVMQHFNVPGRVARRGVLHRRPDVRRLLDPRLPGDPRVGHEADPGPRRPPTSTRSAPRRRSIINFSIRRPVHRRALQPRPAQHRGEGRDVPDVDRHRRHRVLRARGRVLHLRRRALRDQAERQLLLHRLRSRRPGTPAARRRAATSATRPATRAATSRSRRSTTSPTCATRSCLKLDRRRPRRRAHATTRSAPPARRRSTTASTRCCTSGRRHHEVQVHRQEHRLGAAARPRPSCPSRSSATTARACTPTSRCGRTASRCSTTRRGYGGLSDMARWYIGGLLKHAPSLLAFTNPTVNSYHRLVPGYEAPVNLVYSAAQPLGLHPHPDHRRRTRRPSASSSACPTRRATRTSRSRRS